MIPGWSWSEQSLQNRSERRAYDTEIACLQRKLKEICETDACRAVLKDRITQVKQKILEYQ